MDEFKEEANFKRCLKKMNLSNVISAIERAKKIMKMDINYINIKGTNITKKIHH